MVTCILLAVVLVAVFAVSMVRIKSLENELAAANYVLADATNAVMEREEMQMKLKEQ